MTILPVIGVSLPMSRVEAVDFAPASLGGAGGPSRAPDLDFSTSFGNHAMPVSASEAAAPGHEGVLPAEIIPASTPGDEILSGLNKRWTNFTNAQSRAQSAMAISLADPILPSGLQQDAPMPLPAQGVKAWAPVADDYELSLDDMEGSDHVGITRADDAAELQLVRDMDKGGELMFGLSKASQVMTSSIKTLVTGQ